MHAKLPSPRSLLAVCGLLLLFPMVCAATATFKKIADYSDQMPAGLNPDEPFTKLNPILALDTSVPQRTSVVTFSGHTPNRYGMYNFHEPQLGQPPVALAAVAQNQLVPPPGGTTFYLFDSFGHLSADQGQLAFAPAFAGGGIGIGLLKGAPGALSFVATGSTPMPGYTHNFGSFNEVSISDNQVVWRSQSANGSNETGVYSDLGGIHAVALPGDAVPGLVGGTFTSLGNFPSVVVDGSDIIFVANSSSPSVFSHNGIYKMTGGVLSVVMDSNTSRPGAPTEKFASPARLALHQGGIAFAGEWQDLNVFPQIHTKGVYSTVGGLHTVADINTMAPGAGTPFTLFSDHDGAEGGGVAIFEDVVAFVAYTDSPVPFSPRVPGIYLAKGGGTVRKLLAGGDSLDGKTISNLSIRRESLNANPRGGYSLAFYVVFTDFTEAIYRSDFGAPVRKGIKGTGNVTVLRQSSILVEMRNPANNTLIGTLSFLDDGFVPVSAAALPDSDGNGVAEMALLAERISDGRPVVEIRNISGPPAARKIFYSADTNPIAMAVISGDADNNGIAEIAVLESAISNGRGRVEVKNAFGTVNTQTIFVSADLKPLDLEVVDDSDGNGVPEVAILAARISDGRTKVEVANAFGAAEKTGIFFMAGTTPIDLVVLDDANHNSVPDLAVLATRNSDERAVIEVKDASGPPNLFRYYLSPGRSPLAMVEVPDADGNTVDEVAVLSSRDSDGRVEVDVFNAAGTVNLRRILYSPGYFPRSLMIANDVDGNGVPEVSAVMIRDSDDRIVVQSRNASGDQNPKTYLLAP